MNDTILDFDLKFDQFMLSTKDNPYNPFEHFDEWLQYDLEKGHHTCETLARFARCSSQLSDKENMDEIEQAIDQIIQVDPEKKFIKVTKTS